MTAGWAQPWAPTTGRAAFLGGSACERLTDVSSDGLKAYAQSCGQEKALEQLSMQGVDVGKIKRLANGDVDWRDAASATASYEFGTNVDVRELVDDDNNIRWDKVAEAAGSVGAAAACTAYGAGSAAPVCGFVGGKLGAALYAVGDEFVAAVGDIFGSSTPVPPIQVPSPQQSVNLVAQFYLENLRGYLQGLAAVRGVALVAASTARMLSDMLHAATGETVSPNDMIRRMQHAGMSLPGGWTSLLRMNHSYDGYETASQDANGRWQVTTSELGLLHYAFGMNSTPFDAQKDGEIGLFFHGHDLDSQADDHETQMFWLVATQGAPYVRFVSTSADSNDAPWPIGDLAWAWPASPPAHCSLSTQNGGSGPTPPAADRYGKPIVYYDCFADTGHATATDGGLGGFAIGEYGIEVDVGYNDALRRLLVKPADQQAQLRVAWLDSIRRSADVVRADIREAKAKKVPFLHLDLSTMFQPEEEPSKVVPVLLAGGGLLLGALGAWAAWRTYKKEPIVPPKVEAAAKAYAKTVSGRASVARAKMTAAAKTAATKVKGAVR